MRRKGYKQTATGRFRIPVLPETPHCGPETHPYVFPIEVGYDLRLTFNADALDEHGFLLDNTSFWTYFQGLEHGDAIGYSCERLACRIAEDVQRMAGARLTAITVKLEPIPNVTVSVTYEGGKKA